MKRESYDEVRELLSDIDRLSDSADTASKILESVKKNGGTAKIYTHTGEESYTTEVASKTLEVIFTDVLNTYHDLIRKNKVEIDKIIDSTIGG